ncbi:MAG: VanZ family protein [Candidatus Moranbacteria bacterium]|nr:VanZ family protein [Candidatus Moranbacteria bacterium]
MILSFFREKHQALFLLVTWMCVIFVMSSFPGSSVRYEMSLPLLLERKGAHVFEFFVLTMLAYNAFCAFFPKDRSGSLLGLSGALSFLYAFLDETHQMFVPFREGKISDIGIDAIGIALFIVGYALWKGFRKTS